MVSIQAESSPWFHYHPVMPSEQEYVSTFIPTLVPSYEADMRMLPTSIGDTEVEEKIITYLQNPFVAAYLTSPLRFSSSDRYTLFIPIICPQTEESLLMQFHKGKSFEDRELRVQGLAWREALLLRHMVPHRILPDQIQNQEVHIESKNGFFNVNAYGWIDPDNMIEHYIEFPHATIFFIQREIRS